MEKSDGWILDWTKIKIAYRLNCTPYRDSLVERKTKKVKRDGKLGIDRKDGIKGFEVVFGEYSLDLDEVLMPWWRIAAKKITQICV